MRRELLVRRLSSAGIAAAEQEARWLHEAFSDEPGALERALRRREAREPLQLILGTAAFRHLALEVRPGVFIPRPETEVLVEHALQELPDAAVVVEPCTGTGAISCAIADEASPSRVVATDLNPDAVALARRNASAHGVVEVLEGDLLDPVPATLRGRVDLLVCNPPYLTASQVAAAHAEVREWDPPLALVGGEDGRAVTRRLVAEAGEWLVPGGRLLLEDDPSRVAATARDMAAAGLVDVAVLPDLTGRQRMASGRRPG